MQDISRAMTNHRAGDVITITVFRGKRKMDVRLTLGEAREA
jgi:S1-C subfamily serine protease